MYTCAMESFSEGEEIEEVKCSLKPKTLSVADVDVVWAGPAHKTPLLLFNADSVQNLEGPINHPFRSPYHLRFKLGKSDCTLVPTILLAHGFSEVTGSNTRFNLYWSGVHIPLPELRRLLPHQKVNHFPRSQEITRKDKLCQNVSRMQQAKGMRHFNIIPKTFTLPEELRHFQVAFRKQRGTWITKPVSSSRGRGISIINHPNQVRRDEPIVVSQYIEKPLCVNGYKFDLRLYVAVTSFNPLRIYLYEEGLTRFATESYSGPVELHNHCMHLTNYSVNKKSAHYVRCDNPRVDDYGTKWSMSALLRYLHKDGKNVAEMMMRVEDVIVKALIAGESHISPACDIFQPHRGNCFELFGFDILIDENLQPWLLEINLSPSLGCDAPIDILIKSNLVADLFTLVGLPVCDPCTHEAPKPPKWTKTPSRPVHTSNSLRLTSEEANAVRDAREEYTRRGGFVRVFPTEDSWDLYSSFLDTCCKRTLNYALHSQLYLEKLKSTRSAPCSLSTIISKRLSMAISQPPSPYDTPAGLSALERVAVYMRKLENGPKTKPLWDSVKELFIQPAQSVPGVRNGTRPAAVPSSSTQITVSSSPHLKISQLSKPQARQLFAAYLECVQTRLLKETSYTLELQTTPVDDTAKFEVIVGFLRSASENLSSSFTLVEPSPDLPMRDRKRILAKQLAEFIILYKRETVLLSISGSGHIGMATQQLDRVLSESSEEDLERLLVLYARHSKSSPVLLNCSDHTRSPQSDAPSTTDTKQSGKHCKVSREASRVLCRKSQPPRRLPVSSSSQRKPFQHPPKMNWTSESSTYTSAAPPSPPFILTKYSQEMLQSCSLPPHQKKSLDILTKSLEAGIFRRQPGPPAPEPSAPVPHGLPPRGPRRGAQVRRGGGQRGGGRARGQLRRSSSLQSLFSINSDASELSLESSVSGGLAPHPRVDNEREMGPKAWRPRSATIVNGYVSPYAQPARRKSSLHLQRSLNHSSALKAKRDAESCSSVCPPKLPQAPPNHVHSEESITQALHRLTMRQLSWKYSQSSVVPKDRVQREAWTGTTGFTGSRERACSEEPHIENSLRTEQVHRC